MEQELKRIAFIGAGVMGAPMAGHLIDAGYEVHLYTRTQAKAEPLVRRGAIWHGSPAEAVAGADAAITSSASRRTWRRSISLRTG